MSADHLTDLDQCQIMDLPKVTSYQGSLTAVNNSLEIPFNIRRVYYLYDVPGGETRGGHAHHEIHQLIVCVSGSYDVLLDDGKRRRTLKLNRAHQGLYVPPMIWRELVNFSTGAICLVLASENYSEDEYIRDFSEFVQEKLRISDLSK